MILIHMSAAPLWNVLAILTCCFTSLAKILMQTVQTATIACYSALLAGQNRWSGTVPNG